MQHCNYNNANVQEYIMLDVMPPEQVDRSHRCESAAIREGFPSSDRPIGVNLSIAHCHLRGALGPEPAMLCADRGDHADRQSRTARARHPAGAVGVQWNNSPGTCLVCGTAA